MGELRTVSWKGGAVVLIDQRLLPHKLRYIECKSHVEVAEAIRNMSVRGAPAIGVAAAYALALAAMAARGRGKEEQLRALREAAETLRSTRPTAVNLFWAIERILRRAESALASDNDIAEEVLGEADRMAEDDVSVNRRIGIHGSALIRDGARVMTYCNAGALATVSYGTALGVIRAAVEQGKRISVIVPETRPKLQGARLTAYELEHEGIDYRVISDNMAPFLISRGEVDCVITGTDRVIARTGHIVNKIGTLGLALAAGHYGVPFYVAAPLSSFDFEHEAREVVIEERPEDEVLYIGGKRIAPRGARAINYAFDITPPELVTRVITEHGAFRPSELLSLKRYYELYQEY